MGAPPRARAAPTAQQAQPGPVAEGPSQVVAQGTLCFLFRSWELRAKDERRPGVQGDRVLATALERSLLSLEALPQAVARDLLPRMQQGGRAAQVTSQLWGLGWVSPGGWGGGIIFL